jgi:hypothetical protein
MYAQEAPDVQPDSLSGSAEDNAVVYYLDTKSFKLVPEVRELLATTSPSNKVKQVIEWLSINPEEPHIQAIWPESILLRDVFVVDNKTVVVDFYEDSVMSFSSGVKLESMLIYSMVNSILESFPWYTEVWVLLDGHVQETFLGHVDVEKALVFNKSLLLHPVTQPADTPQENNKGKK